MPTLINDEIRMPTRQEILSAAEASEQLRDGTLDIASLPEIALRLFQNVLDELAQGHSVTVQKIESEVTTSEAAEYLHVSRPYVVKLLNEGKLPFKMVGTHRRIPFPDLQEYRAKQQELSLRLMAELQAEAQEYSMGY